MPASIEIEFGNQQLVLLADRALYWPARQTLVIADVHLGKDATFRAAGLPVPAGNSAKDLARITALLSVTAATQLAILGDLVHSRVSHQPELFDAFTRWRNEHAGLDVLLVRGNHDRHAGPPPIDWQVTQVPEPFDAGALMFAHMSKPCDKPILCGHVHPTVAIQDFDRTFARIPCFVVDADQLILPAFGSFTGGYKMQREPGRKIYAVMGKSVVMLPAVAD